MKPADEGDFIVREAGTKEPHHRLWGPRALLAIVCVLVAILGSCWLLRRPIAGQVLANWCAERSLTCKARFGRLDFSGATLTDVTINGDGRQAFGARQIGVDLEWPAFLKPRVSAVRAESPVVSGRLADGRLGLNGLEKLAASGGTGGGGGALPSIEIRNGRIRIETSAGEVGASIDASGQFPQSGHVSLILEPASLDEPQGYVRWTGGAANIVAERGELRGDANLALEEVRTDDFRISAASLEASLEGHIDGNEPARLVWEARADEAAGADFGVAALEAGGQARIGRLEDVTLDGFLGALLEADVQFDSGAARWTDYSAAAVHAETSIRGRDGAISGPVTLRMDKADLPQGKAGQFSVSGDLRWSDEGGFDFAGPVAVSEASLARELTDGPIAKLTLPSPLSAHGHSLQAALRRALAGFDANAYVALSWSDWGLRVGAQDEAKLVSPGGFALTVTPVKSAPWLGFSGGDARFSGDVTLEGGGAPQVSARVNSLIYGKDGLSLSAGQVRIAPWTADQLRFGADLSSATLQAGGDGLSVMGSGALTLSGPAFGLNLNASRISGGLQVHQDAQGILVEPLGQPCLAFATKGVGLGSVEFQPSGFNLCPVGGAYMKPGKGAASGVATLGDVSWPFQSKSVSGTLGLENARLNWTAKKGFAFRLSAPSLTLPLDIDERTLTIDAQKPEVDISTASGRPPGLSARLTGTVFGGTLIPAKVSADTISFDGVIGSGGLSGDLAGGSVLIRDFRDDPVYQPLLSDLTARMDEWQLALSGPLRLQSNDTPIGDIRADINVLNLDGTATVRTRTLDFRKGALQPVMVSERLRGVYTDAVGQITASSDVMIDGGKLAGTADVEVTDFGFQTTRLGRVENVNGRVHFADLFSLTTDPSQVLTIGGMNPGVPLKDGRIVFGFSDGKVLDVASAAFPFAGGTLALSPFEWTLGGNAQHLEVTAKAVELKELVNTLKLSSIEAEGTVSGSFPIDIERTKVLIRNARLFADKDGGRLAYLGDAADSAAQSDANVRLAFEALKDFDFTVLEVGLDGNIADRVQITLKLAGKSRNDIAYGANANIVRGQPFEFNIGIDTALAELFRSSQFYTNQQKVTDFVVKEVLSERGLKTAEDE